VIGFRDASPVLLAVVLALLALGGQLSQPDRVQAVQYVVNSTGDDVDNNCDPAPGDCTIRDAIFDAWNDSGTPDTIVLPDLGPGPETFTVSSQLELEDGGPYTIDGLGPGETILAANGATRVINNQQLGGFWTFSDMTITGGIAAQGGNIRNTRDLTLTNVVVTNGLASADGGGIFNSGTLILNNSNVTENDAQIDAINVRGGGIYSTGSLTLNNSTVSDNTADSGEAAQGGGIYSTGTFTVNNTTITGNRADGDDQQGQGGGVYATGTSTTINRATISDNTAVSNLMEGNGGGLYNSASTQITNSLIELNSAESSADPTRGGGIFNSGNLTITTSSIVTNGAGEGGGIYAGGNLTVDRSLLEGNYLTQAGTGIAIWSTGNLNVRNSTISGNTASFGAAITVNESPIVFPGTDVTVNLTNTTITNNTDGALRGGGSTVRGLLIGTGLPTVNVRNAIIANNQSGNCATSMEAQEVNSLGNNVDSDNSCEFDQPSDHPGEDALLGPLQDNGGLTLTHALRPGSPAVNAGDNPTCAAEPVNNRDQRGIPRPKGGTCDIGAFESRFCQGQPETRSGGNAADTLNGTPAVDVILGFGGADTINGSGGGDFICAAGGDDEVNGGGGNDTVNGGAGSDRLVGSSGNDRLLGLGGNDLLLGSTGDDDLVGGPGPNDVCRGGDGADTVTSSCETGVP
jgi:CSLREA domain-containing protein